MNAKRRKGRKKKNVNPLDGQDIQIRIHSPKAGLKNNDLKNQPVQELYSHNGIEYALFKATWDEKLARPERWLLLFNEDKLRETVESPDEIRQSESPNIKDEETRKNHHIYYKRIDSWKISKNGDILSLASMAYLAVVIDIKYRTVKTFYPTPKMKNGKQIWTS